MLDLRIGVFVMRGGSANHCTGVSEAAEIRQTPKRCVIVFGFPERY